MPPDPTYLREHYESLSDEALLSINRAELVATAQQCYDDEVRSRRLSGSGSVHTTPELGAGDQPDWLDEAVEVYSVIDSPGVEAAARAAAAAREALEAAGIPCLLSLGERPEEEASRKPPPEWRLLVPGTFNQHATSILERDIFNAEFEAEWKAHLQTFSDDELRSMNPQVNFCGLFDRVERVTKAYKEEFARRGLNPEES